METGLSPAGDPLGLPAHSLLLAARGSWAGLVAAVSPGAGAGPGL